MFSILGTFVKHLVVVLQENQLVHFSSWCITYNKFTPTFLFSSAYVVLFLFSAAITVQSFEDNSRSKFSKNSTVEGSANGNKSIEESMISKQLKGHICPGYDTYTGNDNSVTACLSEE